MLPGGKRAGRKADPDTLSNGFSLNQQGTASISLFDALALVRSGQVDEVLCKTLS